MKRDAYLSGASYVLGEAEKTFKQADGFEQALSALGGANFPELWGWGSYYETADIYQLGLHAAQKALAVSAVPANAIQLVVFAAASFPENPNELAPRLGQVLKTLGCANALLESATLNGCASYLSALRLATVRVASGELDNVLVVGLGSMTPGMTRFSAFALFSDAACAVVLRADGANARYRVIDAIQRLDLEEFASGVLLNDKSQLQTQTLDILLGRNQLGRSDINRVFNNNIFLPIKKMRDARSGFKASQLYPGNVARIAHCHVCDSMINLVDYSSQSRTADPELLLLQSDGNGHCSCLLLASL
ncbi:hypothetical protein [Massilia sp. erpn]|uniref:hypothetical protein n=1 Tax=Massilia sp. erpn TaxID=2738142 RepID=UPI002107E2B3|nr:hypothetical protein [Massilia sp. erpn]UTY57462.1 hypothetical protein HPQ68_09800 [Massilia sp. erpn]